ncbi:MAG: hypothetical protein ACOCRK_02125 [bacterium]
MPCLITFTKPELFDYCMEFDDNNILNPANTSDLILKDLEITDYDIYLVSFILSKMVTPDFYFINTDKSLLKNPTIKDNIRKFIHFVCPKGLYAYMITLSLGINLMSCEELQERLIKRANKIEDPKALYPKELNIILDNTETNVALKYKDFIEKCIKMESFDIKHKFYKWLSEISKDENNAKIITNILMKINNQYEIKKYFKNINYMYDETICQEPKYIFRLFYEYTPELKKIFGPLEDYELEYLYSCFHQIKNYDDFGPIAITKVTSKNIWFILEYNDDISNDGNFNICALAAINGKTYINVSHEYHPGNSTFYLKNINNGNDIHFKVKIINPDHEINIKGTEFNYSIIELKNTNIYNVFNL